MAELRRSRRGAIITACPLDEALKQASCYLDSDSRSLQASGRNGPPHRLSFSLPVSSGEARPQRMGVAPPSNTSTLKAGDLENQALGVLLLSS
jgi:hypothetical protein